jgi:hypothetical protein
MGVKYAVSDGAGNIPISQQKQIDGSNERLGKTPV